MAYSIPNLANKSITTCQTMWFSQYQMTSTTLQIWINLRLKKQTFFITFSRIFKYYSMWKRMKIDSLVLTTHGSQVSQGVIETTKPCSGSAPIRVGGIQSSLASPAPSHERGRVWRNACIESVSRPYIL